MVGNLNENPSEAQILVAQTDGTYKPVTMSGDASIAADGTVTVSGGGGGGITALTGDVTASGSGSVVATVANITNAMQKAIFQLSSGGQTIGANEATDCPLDQAVYDPDSICNTETNSITPTKAGVYLVTFGVACLAAIDMSAVLNLNDDTANISTETTAERSTGTAMLQMNGSTDTLTLQILNNGDTPTEFQGGGNYLTVLGPF